MKYTIEQFRKEYPNDAVCLDKIFKMRFGKIEACPCCGVVNPTFKRITTRRSYQCRDCYHQIYPTAGTVFQKTTTPLTYWFYAMYLMCVTRNGVSAKELERVLGVTYKTAWRMAHCIRELMREKQITKLTGFVEMDETYIGGKSEHTGRSMKEKEVVFAMVERLGNVVPKHVNDAKKETLFPIIEENVDKTAKVMTDEFKTYVSLKDLGFQHKTIMHQLKEYRNGVVSTNTVEGFFSQVKRMIFGSHIHVSKKYLSKYLDECAFRYNHRELNGGMFNQLITLISQGLTASSSRLSKSSLVFSFSALRVILRVRLFFINSSKFLVRSFMVLVFPSCGFFFFLRPMLLNYNKNGVCKVAVEIQITKSGNVL